jgi:hypothetical protein
MGLLDDAIREHLELKRRRGADPDEIARQEDEALGDPRSGEFARPDGGADAAPAAVPEEPPPPAPADDPLPPVPTEEEEILAEPAAYEPEPEPEPPAARHDDPWLEDDEPDEPAATGQPTAEFTPPDVEPEPEIVRPDDEPGPDEDVLEETPDFLQETPEHDRLWFEQKPPRDFDFDN